MSLRTAVYAESFDPPTDGHMWMIEQGYELFDKLYILVGRDPVKTPLFTQDERVAMMTQLVEEYGWDDKVAVQASPNDYLVYTAINLEADYILRGLWDVKDFQEEYALSTINTDLAMMVEYAVIPQTIFIPTPTSLAHVSSTMVKSLVGVGNWKEVIRQYVPDEACQLLEAKYV